MRIINKLDSPERTASAIQNLAIPGTIVLADTGNREKANAGHRETLFQSLHDELRSMGIHLAGVPCPYGDYTIAGVGAAKALVQNEADNSARQNAGLKTTIPIQKLDLIQPNSIAVDVKSSAAELYSNLKYCSQSTVQKIRRAAQVGVRLYWLVVDDEIVDGEPSEWTYHGRHASWRAWGDLRQLISAVERAYPHLQIYFCRRSDAAAVLARMLTTDYTPVPALSELERITYDVAYCAEAARIRAWEHQYQLGILRKKYEMLMSMTSELTGLTPEALESHLNSKRNS